MALSTLGLTPRARHGFGAYFAPCAPLHEDPRLVRDAASATDSVNLLGSSRAIVMRGNGAVVERMWDYLTANDPETIEVMGSPHLRPG